MSFYHGSGIYSTDKTYEVECECENDNCVTEKQAGCGNVWEQDFNTNDYGNIDTTIGCPKCSHNFNFSKENDPHEYEAE
jgi:hypothetical protein